MSARLSVCTKEEQRSVIRFLWTEGVKGAKIHARLCTQYGDNALPRRSVYEWIEMFRVTIEEIALQLGISQGTAYSSEHDILRFHKVAAR